MTKTQARIRGSTTAAVFNTRDIEEAHNKITAAGGSEMFIV